jgi:molecular chaperone GrpE (heat shock protein)
MLIKLSELENWTILSLSKKEAREYGDKRDYPKIEIFVDGDYKATTTWAKNLAEAKEHYLMENKDLTPNQVKVHYKSASLKQADLQDPVKDLESQIQSFKDRMTEVQNRLSNPPTKTADLETDPSGDSVKEIANDIAHKIDELETKVHEEATPEVHELLEGLENQLWQIEIDLGIHPDIPKHEKEEPEHQEIVKELENKEEPVEKESAMPPMPVDSANLPADEEYVWDPNKNAWFKQKKKI